MLNIIVKEVTIEEYYKIINGNDIEILKQEIKSIKESE